MRSSKMTPTPPEPKTPAQFTRESEARSISEGAVRMPGGLLKPDAAEALSLLLDAGYAESKNGVITKALLRERKRLKL